MRGPHLPFAIGKGEADRPTFTRVKPRDCCAIWQWMMIGSADYLLNAVATDAYDGGGERRKKDFRSMGIRAAFGIRHDVEKWSLCWGAVTGGQPISFR